MTPENKTRMEKWRKEVLVTLANKLTSMLGMVRDDLLKFNEVTTKLGKEATEGFIRIFGLATTEELNHLDKELKTEYIILIASTFNSALPLDYPFIVALIFSDISPLIKMCVISRDRIPGAHETLSRGIVPILHLKNISLDQGTPGFNVKITEAKHLNPGDDLENMYKQ